MTDDLRTVLGEAHLDSRGVLFEWGRLAQAGYVADRGHRRILEDLREACEAGEVAQDADGRYFVVPREIELPDDHFQCERCKAVRDIGDSIKVDDRLLCERCAPKSPDQLGQLF